jgi:uncharacterized repeat protein (TIGR01451 family)
MNRVKLLSIGVIASIATFVVVVDTPVSAGLFRAKDAIAQAFQGPDVKLDMVVAKRVITKDAQGKEAVSWEDLKNKAVVMPGDSLRYTVSSQNAGDRTAEDLVISQPIPTRTTYELASANSNSNAEITYSIDNGQTYTEKPTIEVTLPNGQVEKRPAPAEAYTHIKWKIGKSIDPKAGLVAMYEVKVR